MPLYCQLLIVVKTNNNNYTNFNYKKKLKNKQALHTIKRQARRKRIQMRKQIQIIES